MMSMLRRMSNLMQQKLNRILDRAEDPAQALDLAYRKQLESLQAVRRNIADVLTSQKRLELQEAQLRQSRTKLEGQAQLALQQGREDLARLALTRAQSAVSQLDGLQQQIAQMREQESKLEVTAQKLQAKVESFRSQKETIKAQYSAAQAQTKIGEAVTGLSEQMADVSMMVERARDKTLQMQARAAAIDQLVDTGALDELGSGSGDYIDRQLAAGTAASSVEAQLEAMKKQLQGGLPTPQLEDGSIVVRVQGEDQYRLAHTDASRLEEFDRAIVAAIDAGDGAALKTALSRAIEFVHGQGQRLSVDQISTSQVVLPAPDMSLEEAREIMAGTEGTTPSSAPPG